MNIILLGPNGQLGSDIKRIHAVNYSQHKLICLSRKELDVADTAHIQQKLHEYQFDILINCSSYNKTVASEENPHQAFLINAFAVKEMAAACRHANARLIHISTDYVFGRQSIQQPITELSAPAPLNVYGSSKLMGESLAQAIHDDIIILRTASLYGNAITNSSSKQDNFVEHIISKAQKEGLVKVVADQIMSPTASLNLAEMIFKLIRLNLPTGVYHAVNTGQVTWFEFATAILNLANIQCDIEPISAATYQDQIVRPNYSALDNTKLANVIGKIPGWKTALSRYLENREANLKGIAKVDVV